MAYLVCQKSTHATRCPPLTSWSDSEQLACSPVNFVTMLEELDLTTAAGGRNDVPARVFFH